MQKEYSIACTSTMRTSISFNLSKREALKTRKLARARGFRTTSDYLRFLITQDDVDLISEHELVRRAQSVDRLHRTGKLMRARSMKDLVP